MPEIGTVVTVIGFKVANDYDSEYNLSHVKSERDYVNIFSDKMGIVESLDDCPRHPVMVNFGDNHIPRTMRFSPSELSYAH